MEFEHIICAMEDNITIITLNRPQVLNALNHKLYIELDQAIEEADKDREVRVIVITGAGRAFCAGEDLKAQSQGPEGAGYVPEGMSLEEFRRERQFRDFQEKPVYRGPGREYGLPGTRLRAINTPSIAAVNGVAVGYGCDLALSCNMRIASEKARFGEFFGRLGVIPEEALQVLPQLVSLCKAYEIILTTDFVEAEEAGKIGLVNKVVPHEELMSATMELATKIAKKSPLANTLVCEGIRRGFYQSQREARQWTNLAFQFLQGSGDWLEASKAFAEKREPQFKGM